MDLGWIATYGSDTKMAVQISFLSQGGSGTEVPDISIEVDDVDEAYRRMKKAKFKIEYDITDEPWVSGVSTYAIPSESRSTSYLTSNVDNPLKWDVYESRQPIDPFADLLPPWLFVTREGTPVDPRQCSTVDATYSEGSASAAVLKENKE